MQALLNFFYKVKDNKSTKSLAVISLTAAQNSVFNSAGLSAREQQIALLISTGKSDKDIAEQLRISPATVASHNKKIFKKLNVHSRLELINKVR